MKKEEWQLNGIWVGSVQIVNVCSIGRKRHISFVVVIFVKNVIKKNTKGKNKMTYTEFIEKCTPCGGNWVAMIMSGIKEVAPEVFEEMPDRAYRFDEVCFIANHLCYDRPHFPFNFDYRGYVIEHTIDGKFLFRDMTEEEMNTPWGELEQKYNGIKKEENGIWKRICEGE